MNLPSRQAAVVISRPGGAEALEVREVPIPVPFDDELLIKVAFAGVNRHDCNQRRRGPTSAHSDIPGLEVSGFVCATGSNVGQWLGRRVCALVDGGGYASYVVASAALSFEVKDDISLEYAAAVPEAMFTIWHNLFDIASLRIGESVLIHGGTSGVGSLAIQILKLLQHPVYATCGSDLNCSPAIALGADRAFNYRQTVFEEEIASCTGGRGVDIILDMAGVEYAVRNISALARRGRVVHLSPGEGDFRVPLRAIMAKEALITGSLLRPLGLAEKLHMAMELRRVMMPMLDDGRISPVIAGILPLTSAGEAHERMESGQISGKLLLEPGRLSA